MYDTDKRQVVRTLYREGKSKKRIANLLEMDVKTVRHILSQPEDEVLHKSRKDRINVDEELLRKVFKQCEGYRQRVHEVLTEEHGLDIGYSTLTRNIRLLGLGEKGSKRSERHPDIPGKEMQHDTSPYTVNISGKRMKVICSGLYMRYSKLRYVKFYPRFNRFTMKCFMEEALKFWGYSADVCIIDNTNLAIHYGTGANAVMVPEMITFARNYGFEWKAHEIKHSNRKAGKERNFWSIETNFFPGRIFASLEDLNRQAFEWATVRYAKRPQSKTGLIPNEAFEYEKPFLNKLPEYIAPVYKPHRRKLDDYGYVSFEANYYWVPEYDAKKERINDVDVIQYAASLAIFHKRARLALYRLPAFGVRNSCFTPNGVKFNRKPKNRKVKSKEEETAIRDMGEIERRYLEFVLSRDSGVHHKHQYTRQLYRFFRKLAPVLRQKTLQRALQYQVNNIEALNRIAFKLIRNKDEEMCELSAPHAYMEREAYRNGQFNHEPGFENLNNLLNGANGDEINPQ